MIHRLIYKSTLVDSVDEQQLLDIVQLAALKNYENEVTGCLFVRDQSIIQYFEGCESKVETLWNAILSDKRHSIEVFRMMKKSEDRMFQSWSMGYLEESPFDRTVNQLFSMLEESFSPYFKDVDKLIDLRLKLAFDFLARRNLVTDFLS
ncbi:MAG: BLUF domain-containing protein [Pseudobacteriovorax sp.]|nr:BLUF domain-containing protein [Pseudobacteriovorax sp.]